jgi:hypothetical protein
VQISIKDETPVLKAIDDFNTSSEEFFNDRSENDEPVIVEDQND